jgi:2,3,4,5-tetrahydropyridine-2,6-dicarboxylate N-succinyltransferase
MSDLHSGATGEGFATVSRKGVVLDAWFPEPRLTAAGGRPATTRLYTADPSGYARADEVRQVEIVPLRTDIASLQDAPVDTQDAYLRLHLLSHRLVKPNTINLDGLFQKIETVAWTTAGPCALDDLQEARIRARVKGVALDVKAIDKIPRMTDFVVPSGVRIADAGRVRLGAYLAEGTMVMHEGFCNFNAGTLGACMVEGRISQGIVVGAGSDIGGGASLMGTLSGGGKERVSIGERCLVGANAGLGIALGDDCVVEAGCYITAGSLIKLEDGRTVKARELSGQNGLLFWRNSRNGALEAIKRKTVWGSLNPQLHAAS